MGKIRYHMYPPYVGVGYARVGIDLAIIRQELYEQHSVDLQIYMSFLSSRL